MQWMALLGFRIHSVSGLQRVNLPARIYSAMAGIIARVAKQKRGSLLWFVVVVTLVSLSLSLLFVSLLASSDRELSRTSSHHREKVRGDGNYRNILDVHYPNLEHPNMEQEAKGDKTPAEVEEPRHNRTVSDCKGPWPGYPECGEKIQWMQEHWESDKCYANHGVTGSLCSNQIYLSEVEFFCPVLPEREKAAKKIMKDPATLHYNADALLAQLRTNVKFEWITNRIRRLWPQWSKALGALEARQPFTHSSEHVLIHIGALSDKSGFQFAENAGKGGPLGELVQWSDLIASLYALGYKIDFSTESDQLKEFLVVNLKGGCPTASETKYTAVFVDIVGLRDLKKQTKTRFQMYQCLLRILDTFGTEPVFNYKKWKPERDDKGHDYGHTWGNWGLNPRQFMTMYPHTPDNSFLGFVVEVDRPSSPLPAAQKNISLVYGKELYMWDGKREYLEVIRKYLDVHATIGTTKKKGDTLDWNVVPEFVHNHGILGGPQLQQLLQQSRFFVGLGFPYEGPAPLEAIAQSSVFLNPKLSPPIDRSNSDFFANKPTNRKIDSQNPYMAMFVGKPYVYTIDLNNMSEVESTIQEILKQPPPPPYIPYEFTFEGMLERLTAYLNNQRYCGPNQWPPADMLITHISEPGQSCKDACYKKGLVCEPELFPLLNTEAALSSNGLKCSSVKSEFSVHGPSISSLNGECSLQVHKLLLSCAGDKEAIRRLCPCREYRKGQVALCLSCTR